MNWEAIGAIGEIIGALAVVITLIFLTLQLRQNTQASRAQIRAAVTQEILQMIAHEREVNVSVAFAKGRAGEDLTNEERVNAITVLVMRLRHWENVYYQYRHGLFDEGEFQGLLAALERDFQFQFMKDVWAEQRSIYSEEFQKLIDPYAKN